MVTQSELGLTLSHVESLSWIFVRLLFLKISKYSYTNDLRDLEKIHLIFPHMLSGNHLAYVAISNDLHGHNIQTLFLPCHVASVYEIWWEFVKHFFRYRAENILNDFKWPSDLENEVKVTRFHLVLRLALVPLGAKFSEIASNISSDIKRKPF